MRTAYPLLVVVALGLASMMVGISGFGGVVGVDDPALESEGAVNGSVERVGPDQEFSGEANSDDDDIVGLILSGGRALTGVAGLIVLLPAELQKLGIPAALAIPAGVAGQLLVGIGLIQFYIGRRYQ
jgi:hypothetical protein